MAKDMTFLRVLKNLGETSSLHGIPKIVSSRQLAAKIIWTFLLLGAFGILAYQLDALFMEYFSYPVKTSVSRKYSHIRMPAITFCNMNPIKASKVTDGDLRNLLATTSDIGTGIGHSFDPFYEGETDAFRVWRENVLTSFRKYPVEERKAMGSQVQDFVLEASFSNMTFQPLNYLYMYTSVPTTDYGNCFTINRDDVYFKQSGQAHGLNLILNLEIKEYVETLSTGYGVRLVLHEPGTYPFPDREGITLNPAFETKIALKMVDIQRLGGLYGDCTDGKTFSERFGINYTTSACYARCEMEIVLAQCDCVAMRTPALWETQGLKMCETNDTDYNCMYDILEQLANGSITCNCASSCHQKVFSTSVSGRKWPNVKYLEKVLLKESCKRNISSMAEICAKLDVKGNNISSYVDNFLSVNVYFEDLNYESIIEEPLYNIARFLADIGGVMGLFVGASVLTCVEVLHILLELALCLRHRMGKRPKTSLKKKMTKRQMTTKVTQVEHLFEEEPPASRPGDRKVFFCS